MDAREEMWFSYPSRLTVLLSNYIDKETWEILGIKLNTLEHMLK